MASTDTHFTVEIQATDGNVWQTVTPAETIDTAAWGSGWTAEDVAQATADNQTTAEGTDWRVRVWHGADADTKTTPAYVWTPAQ